LKAKLLLGKLDIEYSNLSLSTIVDTALNYKRAARFVRDLWESNCALSAA